MIIEIIEVRNLSFRSSNKLVHFEVSFHNLKINRSIDLVSISLYHRQPSRIYVLNAICEVIFFKRPEVSGLNRSGISLKKSKHCIIVTSYFGRVFAFSNVKFILEKLSIWKVVKWRFVSYTMFSHISLIYSKNNRGPSTLPWGTP